MTRKTKKRIIICVLSTFLPIAWLFSPVDFVLAQTDQTHNTDVVEGSGILDGLTFSAMLGPNGKPLDIQDSLIFENGTFVSTECEKQCNYPAQAYFARRVGEKIEFISETRCLTKDAEIVWRGTIDGDNIKGIYSWTANRWYWTIEKEFRFEGILEGNTTSISGK